MHRLRRQRKLYVKCVVNLVKSVKKGSAIAETICPLYIEGRHRMLYVNIQRTKKYSIATC